MKLENQVVSLELAKQLKELGFEQESYFYYSNEIGKIVGSSYKETHNRLKFISAYTVAELYSLLYSNGICDILLNVEPNMLANYLTEKLCQSKN